MRRKILLAVMTLSLLFGAMGVGDLYALNGSSSNVTSGLNDGETGDAYVSVSTYEGLKTALQKSGNYQLTADITVDEQIEVPFLSIDYKPIEITLDLNGHKITADGEIYPINNNGTLTINDSQGTGAIEGLGLLNGKDATSGNTRSAAASLTINGGTYKNLYDEGAALYAHLGSITINGGRFIGKHAAIWNENANYINIYGGYFEGDYAAIINEKYIKFDKGELNGLYLGENGYSCVVSDNVIVYEARIVKDSGYTSYKELADAVRAATEGDEITILTNHNGSYKVPSGKNITITGADVMPFIKEMPKEPIKFANIGAHNMGGASMTFNNVTFEYTNANYTGLQHSGDLVYNNCTFNGQPFLYGNSETFNKCTFNQTSSDAYNVWTYGAKTVNFNECVFNSAGKSVLIYKENDPTFIANVNVTKCTFKASTVVAGKAAIEMDSSLTGGINLTINGETTATGFADGNVSGNQLWNNKKGNDNNANNDITVVVNGVTVLEPIYMAKNGETKHRTLQEAINAAQNDETVTLLEGGIAENVTVNQAPDYAITIDGADKTFKGTITIDGKSAAYETAGVIIKNVNFDAKEATDKICINLGVSGNNNTRYISNVTVDNCTFTGTNNTCVGIKSYTGGDKNLTIKNCVATNMHSLAQLKNVAGIVAENCKVTGKNGISLGASSNAVIEKCEMNLTGYGVRANAEEEGAGTIITDSKISAFIPVVVREAEKDYALTFNGTNTMTASNTDGLWCAIGTSEYEANGTMPTAPTGNVTVTLNDDRLDPKGVYGNYQAVKLQDVNGNLISFADNFEKALADAIANANVARIEIFDNLTQESYTNPNYTYEIQEGRTLTIGAAQPYTISLTRSSAGTFNIYAKNNNSDLVIEENVTIKGLNILANGFATSYNDLTINGDVEALSLKQWTSGGTITVSETGSVVLGYGDGQFDMAYGNGTVTINGNGDKTAAQFKAGYSGTRGNGNTLNLNNTCFEGGAWFNVNGSNGIFNINNSLLKVSGGDAACTLTVASSGNTFNLTNGAELNVATLILGAGNEITISGESKINVTTLKGDGNIVIDAENMTTSSTPIVGNVSDFTGNIEIINNDELGYKIEDGKIKLIDLTDGGTWGGIDWAFEITDWETGLGTLTIKPTTGTPTTDNSGKWSYEVGQWPEAVRYNGSGVAAEIGLWPYDRTKVKTLVIEEGVTSIGSFTAQGFTNLTGEVIIPSTVTYIGQEAFQKSTMTKLTFAAGGTKELCIAHGAFKNLIIEEVSLPADRHVHLHAWVFNNCHNLKDAILPATLVSVHGTNHIDYLHSPNTHADPTWTQSSEIFAYNEDMETITFGSEEVMDMFYSKNNGTNLDYTVANVGLTTYCDLKLAVDAAKTGDTITIINNLTKRYNNKGVEIDNRMKSEVKIEEGKTVVINLNNKKIEVIDNGKILATNANLTVYNGTITNENPNVSAIEINAGVLALNNVNITSARHALRIDGAVEATINGGTYKVAANTSGKTQHAVNVSGAANVTIKAGTFVGPKGTTADSGSALKVQNDAKVTVEGGDFSGGKTSTISAQGSLTISGGTFDQNKVYVDDEQAIENFLAEGYICELNADGKYEVVRGLVGKGTEEEPYLINNIDDLTFFRNDVNLGVNTKYNAPGVWVALGADIDMAEVNWTPSIGLATTDHGFMGNFDGNEYKIKNLKITNPALDSDGYAYAGLFGITEGTDKDNQNTIKNLTIENVTIYTTGQIVAAAIAYPYYTKVDNVKVCGNIAIEGDNYTAGVLAYTRRCVNASKLAIIGANNSYVKGAQTVGGVISDIQTNGGLIANYSNFSAEGISVTGTKNVGGISGIISAQTLDGASVKNVTLSSGDAKVGIVSGALGDASTISNVVFENVTGATAIVGAGYDSGKPVEARINDTYYTGFVKAFAAAQDSDTITMLADVALTETIKNTKKVILDLNGKTITGTDNNTSGNFYLFNNTGELTVTGEGTITLVATTDRDWNSSSVVIANNPGGKLTIENGTIEHRGGTDMAYAIDNLTNGKGTYAETVINGGTMKSTYRAVRQFLNGTEAQNILTVNGGTIEGTNKSIWMQDPSKNANTGTLTVGEYAILKGNVYLSVTEGSTEWPVEVAIAAAALENGSEVMTANVPVGYELQLVNDVYKVRSIEAKIGEVTYATLADAVYAAKEGDTITLVTNVTFTEETRTHNSGVYYDGLYYIGDRSFTIDLNEYTITQDGSVNDYLLNFKNDGEKANVINLTNGTIDAGTAAYCAICTSSGSTQKVTINTENIKIINKNSNGSTIKVRGGAELNVKADTEIIGNDSYLGIECVASTVNIYDGAEIYMNGKTSYNGCLVGACANGIVNVYGGYGKGVSGGFIAMTSGGTINVFGGEWIANTDGTVGNNSNVYVLTAQNNKYESGYVGASIINVTGGTFRGGMDAWILNDANVEKAELNISGGNFNADPTYYVVKGYVVVKTNDTWTVQKGVAKIDDVYYATLTEAISAAKAGDKVEVFEGTYAVPSMKAGITIEGVVEGEGEVLFEGTLSGTLENLTLKNIHIKGGNAQRWAYAKGDLVFENVIFDATSVYALHFDGITEGATLLYKDCTIIGWAAMGGSPASCTFDGCTFKGNGSYGLIRTYFETTIEYCTFDVANVNTNDIYQDGIHAVGGDGKAITVNECTNVNGEMIDIVNISDMSQIVLDGEMIQHVAKIGEKYYRTFAEAISAVQQGGTITLVRDIAVEEGNTVTVDNFNIEATGVIITNNGTFNVAGESTLNIETLAGENIDFLDGAIIKNSTIGGGVFVAGNVTFRGDNTFAMLYDYGTLTDYYDTTANMKWTVEKGASLTLTNKARYGLGYGDNVTINGNITYALTARESLTEADRSLFMHGLVAQESEGWNCNSKLTVEDAYVVLGSNNSFGNKPDKYGGNYTINFTNSVVDASRITFYEALSVTEFTFKKSDVRIGTFMTRDADSKFTLKDSKVLSTATTNGNDEGNYNAGELTLDNSSLTYSAQFVNTGVVKLDLSSLLTAPSVTGTGAINIDATDFDGNEVCVVKADMSSFTGAINITGANYIIKKDADAAGLYVTGPQGTMTRAYTSATGYWGECGGNANESFEFKFYNDGTYMGQTSLKNVGNIINGNVYVTWYIDLDAASNTDEYWSMSWEKRPTLAMQPNRVEQWVDGEKVAECALELNWSDSIFPVIAAVTDSEGVILSYVNNVDNATLNNAFNAGGNITAFRDFTLTETLTIPAGKTVTLDLNGKTIAYSSEVAGDAMITNRGDLTITDNTADKSGKIIYTYKGAPDTYYGKGNYTISNSGVLTLNAGTVENATAQMSHASYAIDNNSNNQEATLTVNGGMVINTNNYAVRQVAKKKNVLNVNGGEIKGTRAVWMQLPGNNTAVAPEVELNVTGGTLTATGESADYKLAVYSYSYGNDMANVKLAISGGTFNGDIALTGGENKGNIETLYITGGTFKGVSGDVFSYGDEEKAIEAITIVGGIFSSNYAERYALDNGYKFVENTEDGTYIIIQYAGTQTRELPDAGWYWFSSYINFGNGEEALDALQAALGSNASLIKGQNGFTQYLNYNGTNFWTSDLTTLSTAQMYMIKTKADDVTVELTGNFEDYANTNIELVPGGWKWIGYPVDKVVSLNEAIPAEALSNGDFIKDQTGSATYYVDFELPNGNKFTGWDGSLTEMKPGHGYMFKSVNGATFSYTTNSNGSRSTLNTVDFNGDNHWIADATQYPNNMNIVAMMSIDGEIVKDNYEVAAFANGECRGSARPVYIEALDSYVLYMTIHGEDMAELTFKYYDVNYGTEYELDNRLTYSSDAILGSLKEPYMFALNIMNIDETSLNEINIYPNPTTTDSEINLQATCDKVEVYNSLGVKIAEYQNVDSIDALETAGVYVIRITDNNEVKHCRLVVK